MSSLLCTQHPCTAGTSRHLGSPVAGNILLSLYPEETFPRETDNFPKSSFVKNQAELYLLWFFFFLFFLPFGYINYTNSCYLECTYILYQVIIHQILQSPGRIVNLPSRQSYWGFGQGALLAERILWLPCIRARTVSVTQWVILMSKFSLCPTACEVGLYAARSLSYQLLSLTAFWFEKAAHAHGVHATGATFWPLGP